MEVQECPVLEVQRGQTHRHMDRNFSKPFTVTLPKGEGQIHTIVDSKIKKMMIKNSPFRVVCASSLNSPFFSSLLSGMSSFKWNISTSSSSEVNLKMKKLCIECTCK